MPRFRIRLNDPDSDEFRVYRLAAESEEAAIALLERRELRAVDWFMDDEQLDDLEAKEASDDLTGPERGMLHSHRQTRPYEVVEVVNLSELVPALADADEED